jgi:hypothetical protein
MDKGYALQQKGIYKFTRVKVFSVEWTELVSSLYPKYKYLHYKELSSLKDFSGVYFFLRMFLLLLNIWCMKTPWNHSNGRECTVT